ncbi:unnamed protein product [Rotaria sordida]|uniref:Uncharacterized protein n=1 Tax=Rotaria sordida TaxID=392033 RepID=A0A813Q0W8_9BILA|nr:unnamed protein product [Rotaria sordida]CAF0768200.1 unnamed protein product [Rotaria sordida]CAF0847666.1 unnamed protein product [Rotaria sordida]
MADANSANSTNELIIDNYNNKKRFSDDQSFDDEQISAKNEKENFQKLKKSESSPPQSPTNRPSYRGPFGITVASTIIWYICIGILFIISFISLVLSILYFVTDSSKESVVKLYGISGAGTLAIITFIIVFLDCCNDGNKKAREQEATYRILQEKEAREKAFAIRRSRRIAEGKEEKPKPFIIQHHRPPNVTSSSHPHPYYHLNPHHTHHLPQFPSTSYHHPFVCPICHDLHASGNARHNLSDIGVDTSDKFDPVAKSKKVIHKSTRDAQTEPKLWDTERGTQTDRTEGTQTSTMELSGMPSNVTQIIHETTILKAPRNLISTLKTSMAQQDKDIAINRAVTDTNTMTPTII